MSNSSTTTRVPETGHDYASFVSPLPHPGALLREDYLPDYGLTAETLALAMEVSPREGPLQGAAPAAVVRRHAAGVLDAVYRNGIVPPWDIAPHLTALLTDPAG